MSNRLHMLIPSELNTRLSKAAQCSRMSRSERVRRVLQQSLRHEGPRSDPVARLAMLNAPTADIGQMLAEIRAGHY